MLKIILLLSLTLISTSLFASYPCRPDLGAGCPGTPSNDRLPGGSLPPGTGEQEPILVIGYAEVPSPQCEQKDLDKALKIAKQNALEDAKAELGTDQIVEVSNPRITKKCAIGIYRNSSKGLSWIVENFASYKANF